MTPATPKLSLVEPDGRARVVAQELMFPNGCVVSPDGICLDAEGAVWLASPASREVLRVREGGEVTHRLPMPGQPVACMLGGAQRRTLYNILSGKVMVTPEQSRELRGGTIHAMEVAVAGAGRP